MATETGDGAPVPLKSPFPFFGGKTRAAPLIWAALGDVPNYVEPFAGSLAVLFQRPSPPGIETVNDQDGFIANVFRALAADAAAVAYECDRPVNEIEMTAFHLWLVARRQTLTERLMADPDYYDTRIAGRWLYGIGCWIGSGWCAGDGAWHSIEDPEGGPRQLIHLGNAGRGVHRQRVHGDGSLLQDAQGSESQRSGPDNDFDAWFAALEGRLARVRVCCGDWTRVLGPSVTYQNGLTGIVLDPPYADTERTTHLYACDSVGLAEQVRQWALAHGDNPLLRIVLCGYETPTYTMPATWQKMPWTAHGGYAVQGNGRGRVNRGREMLWCSPACLRSGNQPGTQQSLFA